MVIRQSHELNDETNKTDSKMSDDGAGIVFLIKCLDQKRVVNDAILDCFNDLMEDTFRRVDEDLVQMFLLAGSIQEHIERFDPVQFVVREHQIL